jgi:hypothetical protein
MINFGQAFDGNRGRYGGDGIGEMMAQARRDQLLNEARSLAYQAGGSPGGSCDGGDTPD